DGANQRRVQMVLQRGLCDRPVQGGRESGWCGTRERPRAPDLGVAWARRDIGEMDPPVPVHVLIDRVASTRGAGLAERRRERRDWLAGNGRGTTALHAGVRVD